MDYGYHAPTMSFPVPGTLMIEPTESETKAELDRFCDALIAIHGEMAAVASGESDKLNNPLKHAPHTAAVVTATDWPHPYSRESAAFPDRWTRASKFWPTVGRVDNVYGDRNLVCSCVGMEAYAEAPIPCAQAWSHVGRTTNTSGAAWPATRSSRHTKTTTGSVSGGFTITSCRLPRSELGSLRARRYTAGEVAGSASDPSAPSLLLALHVRRLDGREQSVELGLRRIADRKHREHRRPGRQAHLRRFSFSEAEQDGRER
jgi:hypothetical protein